MIPVEITVSEGGTWFKLDVPSETLCRWLASNYVFPQLDGNTTIYAIKMNINGCKLIKDFTLAAQTWRVEK